MKEQAIQKINKIGKVSTIVSRICKILVIVGMVACLAGGIICMVLPKDLVKVIGVEKITTEVNYEALGIEIPADKLEEIEEMKEGIEDGSIRVETVRNGVTSGMTFVSQGNVGSATEIFVEENKVVTEVESETMTVTLRDVAVLMFVAVMGLLMTVVTLHVIEGLCKAFRDCQSPFEENVVNRMQRLAYVLIPWTLLSSVAESALTSMMSNSMSWSLSLNMGVVLVVLVVLVLVYIFKYGAVLQQESDETL